jgi:UDP-3-O-[3-hydroxymyristoyl] N-acetylglucosamine deacetylase
MNFINNQVNTKPIMQTTLKNKLLFSGVGIHNGRAVKMSIEPAKPNTGIIFKRVDLDNNNLIKSIIDNVETSQLCTKITNNHGISVSTIEHLMATFNGLKIDNAIIKINSPELPAMDGSSDEYTQKIIKSGIKIQNISRKYLKILKKITVREDHRYISITPANELTLDIEINYPNTIIGNDKFSYKDSQEEFIKNISKARTFAFYEDIEKMRTVGLAIGGSLNNAIVVDKFKIVNSSGLRLDKEFTKHKVLDCLGDFYLLGMPIIGKIESFAPGHRLNEKFIKEILKDKTNYKIQNQNEEDPTDTFYNLLVNDIDTKKIKVA